MISTISNYISGIILAVTMSSCHILLAVFGRGSGYMYRVIANYYMTSEDKRKRILNHITPPELYFIYLEIKSVMKKNDINI